MTHGTPQGQADTPSGHADGDRDAAPHPSPRAARAHHGHGDASSGDAPLRGAPSSGGPASAAPGGDATRHRKPASAERPDPPDPLPVVGVDLSGPMTPSATALALFVVEDSGLVCRSLMCGLGDEELAAEIPAGRSVVGLDAPLSYSAARGDRPGDRQLRKLCVRAGLPAGSVMAPTAPRIVYLTLRGISITRRLARTQPNADIVEVHPAAALALRGAPPDAVTSLKQSGEARRTLIAWLERHGLQGIERFSPLSDHAVAACAAALAAWAWHRGEPAWVHPAAPPAHPYDYAC